MRASERPFKMSSQSLCSGFFITLINMAVHILSYFLPRSLIECIRCFIETLPRDLRFLCTYTKVVMISIFYEKTNTTVIDLFDQNVRLYPNKLCFISEGSEWSFKEVEQYSRRIAHTFKDRLAKGDVVGLLMTNRAQYAPIWLGMGRLGAITALINTNQKNIPLTHSITTVKPKLIIFSPDMASSVDEIVTTLDPEIELFCLGQSTGKTSYLNLQDLLSSSSPDYSRGPKLNYADTLLYIYTSGSTGLPKAAVVPHCRFMIVGTLLRHVIGVTPHDRIYCPLPLYHGSGGVLGTASALIVGGTTVVREKFSASSYFKDCIKYNCTIGQYIGETARYMLSTLPLIEDKIHSVRMLTGNGLQSDVWQQLYTRFNVPDIFEFYGSTEGNITLVNTENLVGSCGFIPRFIPCLRKFLGIYIIQIDETGTPNRQKNGLCVPCKLYEPGLLVGLIKKGSMLKQFYGYVNQEESNKNKCISNVFKKGDEAFSSGDILVEDKLGYFYFKDRMGDTFRWKGENVATTEVEHVLKGFSRITECAVYGVQIPGHEGRAGMAAIVDHTNQVNLTSLSRFLEDSLPKYAQPLLIRFVPGLDYTSTFKVKKFNLQKQGFDPNVIKDPLFFKKGISYDPLTPQIFSDITKGNIQF